MAIRPYKYITYFFINYIISVLYVKLFLRGLIFRNVLPVRFQYPIPAAMLPDDIFKWNSNCFLFPALICGSHYSFLPNSDTDLPRLTKSQCYRHRCELLVCTILSH